METATISFEYNKLIYKAIVRIKHQANPKEYHITIMNGELEKLLFGSHIFIKNNSEIKPKQSAASSEVVKLQKVVMVTLLKYLKPAVR